MPINLPDWLSAKVQGNPLAQLLGQLPEAYEKGLDINKKRQELPYAGATAKSTAEYKTAMAKYLSNPYQMQRFMTPLGKLLNEQQMQSGKVNINGQEYDPYTLELIKHTTDADTRKRNLFAQNIEKTASTINPEDLTRYSGITGPGKKAFETAKSMFGKASPEFTAHLEAERSAHQLATQVRQFYGESIQPEVRRDLNNLTNPSFWNKSPEMAADLYKKYIALLKMETNTYESALKSGQPYGFKNTNAAPAAKEAGNAEGQMPPMGTIWMVTSKGQKVPVHESQISNALMRGLKKVE